MTKLTSIITQPPQVFINFAMGNTDLETTPIQNEEDSKSLDSIEAVKS